MAQNQIEINFKNIQPHDGDNKSSFESLCCNIFFCSLSENQRKHYIKFNGAGGDGGLECIANHENHLIGIQAKYVFTFQQLKAQATKSFRTAISLHKDLSEFFLFFPFDLTSDTKKKDGSSSKFLEWKTRLEKEAEQQGINVRIIKKSGSDIKNEILKYDTSGAIRQYYFGKENFNLEWFSSKVNETIFYLGKRFNSNFQIPTETTAFLDYFCNTTKGRNNQKEILKELNESIIDFRNGLASLSQEKEKLPKCYNLKELGKLADNIEKAFFHNGLTSKTSISEAFQLVSKSIETTDLILRKSQAEYEKKHGKGSFTNNGLRQFYAEYLCSFQMKHLDCLSTWIKELNKIKDWINSGNPTARYEQFTILKGMAGIGKTNALCVAAGDLIKEGSPCLLFAGSQFSNKQDVGLQILQKLRVPGDWTIDQLFDCFEYVAMQNNSTFVIFIDAINETGNFGDNFWLTSIPEIFYSINKRANIKMCFSCRSGFETFNIPDDIRIPQRICEGFKRIRNDAITSFFGYYNINLPTYPLLNEEFTNPLFLTLFCEAISDEMNYQLSSTWTGFNNVFMSYSNLLAKRYNIAFGSFAGKDVINDSIFVIGNYLLKNQTRTIPRKQFTSLLFHENAEAKDKTVDWLISENFLISPDNYSTLQPAFDKIGDYIIAKAALQSSKTSVKEIKHLALFESIESIKLFRGAVSVLSNMVPEEEGVELTDLFDETINPSVVKEIKLIILESLKSRNPKAITENTKRIVLSLLPFPYFSLFENLFPLAIQGCCLNVFFLTSYIISSNSMGSIANMDSILCPYLYYSYETNQAVFQIIETGRCMTKQIDYDYALRLCLVLALFTSSSDRRVKDNSTRALVNVLLKNTTIAGEFLNEIKRMSSDSVVFERSLLAVYGFILLSRNKRVICQVCDVLETYYDDPPYHEFLQNGEIRELMGSIFLFAQKYEDRELPDLFQPIITSNDWLKPAMGSISVFKERGSEIGFSPSDFLSDFYKYSLRKILRCFLENLAYDKQEEIKQQAGKWIVARIIDFYSYTDSDCKEFDDHILSKYGGGRNKPVWAERIGKKYQWLASHEFVSNWFDKCKIEDRGQLNRNCFLGCRELDPTVLFPLNSNDRESHKTLYISYHFEMDNPSDFNEWVYNVNDIPSLSSLISKKTIGDQTFLPLYYSLSETEKIEYGSFKPYRRAWFFVWGYIIELAQSNAIITYLSDKNFDGRWMPEPAVCGSPCFLGEYNYKTQDDYQVDFTIDGSPFKAVPIWKDFVFEWEQDSSTGSVSSYLTVPTQRLLTERIIWDGKNSWIDEETNKPIFIESNSNESAEKKTLFVDFEYISKWLKERKLTLLWTMLGERQIIDCNRNGNPIEPLSFSQIAWIDETGTIQESKCNYFDLKMNKLELHIDHPEQKTKSKKRNTEKSNK